MSDWQNKIIGHDEVAPDQLMAHPSNWRIHPAYQQKALRGVINDIGFIKSVTVNQRTGRVIDGHLRVTLALRDNIQTIPVEYVDLTEAEEAEALLTLDPIAALAGSDKDNLESLLGLVETDDADVKSLLEDTAEKAGVQSLQDGPEQQARKTLAERFGVPPFSVLDARQGYWQNRKRAWIALGLKGELGRGGNIGAVAPNENGENGILARTGKYATKENNGLLGISKQARSHYKKEIATSYSSQSRLTALQKTGNSRAKVFGTEGSLSEQTGTSIFDPVLSELLYRWFMPKGGHVLNPMSGEATHGIVAGYLGYKFTGVELRPEQAESNREQARNIGVDPVWITADALTIDALDITPADFVVSCPPYADLEVYSDNPLDISTMDYPDFIRTYSEIIRKSCDKLKDNRFAAFVVGEVRDKNGIYYDFVGDTIKAFKAAGLKYYNEMILVTSVGSLPIRAGRQFEASRKIGKTHQNVLVFLKGDSKQAVKDCGNIEMELPDGIELG